MGFGGSGGEIAIEPEGSDNVLLDGDVSEMALDDVGAAPADSQKRSTARDRAAVPLQAPHSQADVIGKAAEAADVKVDSRLADISFGAAHWCGAGSDGSDGSRLGWAALRAGVSDSSGSDGGDHGTREDRAAGQQRQRQQEQKRAAAGCSNVAATAAERDAAATEHAEEMAAAAMCRRPTPG